MKHKPHNYQEVLNASDDEDYLDIKNLLKHYEVLFEAWEAVDIETQESDYIGKNKGFRQNALFRINKAYNIMSEITHQLNEDKHRAEEKIIETMLNRPVASRKVNIMESQKGVKMNNPVIAHIEDAIAVAQSFIKCTGDNLAELRCSCKAVEFKGELLRWRRELLDKLESE